MNTCGNLENCLSGITRALLSANCFYRTSTAHRARTAFSFGFDNIASPLTSPASLSCLPVSTSRRSGQFRLGLKALCQPCSGKPDGIMQFPLQFLLRQSVGQIACDMNPALLQFQ
jgi:hypothetical protein